MIYFDNAATSYPKPSSVIFSTNYALKNYSFNSGRGGYKQSLDTSERIYSVREKVAEMFSFSPDRVVFTKNCTEALNMAIKGVVKKGDHIVISNLEHNSVSRVVEKLKNDGVITYDIAGYSNNPVETLENFRSQIKDNTKVVVCMHSSNAFGVTFQIRDIGKMCHNRGIIFIVDGAQGAGVSDINAKRDNIDILCAPGHKSLYGSMGTGFLAIGDNIEIGSLIEGGTGSNSLSLSQPDFLPDKLEAGTLNNSGIISLGAGIDYINKFGIENIYEKELKLCQYVYEKLSSDKRIKLYTDYPQKGKAMPIVSFNYLDYPSEKTASFLSSKGICTRAGYHCSPFAHKHFGTLKSGTVRLSFGAFNNINECKLFLDIVKKL